MRIDVLFQLWFFPYIQKDKKGRQNQIDKLLEHPKGMNSNAEDGVFDLSWKTALQEGKTAP